MPTLPFTLPLDMTHWFLLGGLALLLLMALSTQKVTRGTVPYFRFGQRPTALYVFRGRHDPTLVKVGYTGRSYEARQRELECDCGEHLDLVLLVRMPHAWYAEQRLHGLLTRKGWRLPPEARLGTEWYRVPLKQQRTLIKMVQGAASATRRQARRRISWSRRDQIKAWVLATKPGSRGRLAPL